MFVNRETISKFDPKKPVLRQSVKNFLFIIGGLLLLFLVGLTVFYFVVKPDYPELTQDEASVVPESIHVQDQFRSSGPNWLKQNTYGIWEMYIEGQPFERGLVYGQLATDLVQDQERYFVEQIREMIPSQYMLSFLKYFIAWFNRDIDDHIPEEYKKEIYGISKSFSDDFDYIAPKYYRILNYHAAHDIGHALQDIRLVGCTSFAAWGPRSYDSTLIIGRNFDFSVGDDFARNKLVTFFKPEKGIPFMSVSWGGMIGVVSGMNREGLTVTLNAARSEVPTGSKTPISLLAREILQYASTIEEAYAIAAKRSVFVSESLLIGSARDKRAAIIEKGPNQMGLYEVDNGRLVCANHYQSQTFRNDPSNLENLKNSDSESRFERTNELMQRNFPITPTAAAGILRDQKGVQDIDIGMANPKAINQLLAHHGIIFKPESKKVWISAYPYQLGAFVCYDLDSVFSKAESIGVNADITEEELLIPEDSFLYTQDYKEFQYFHQVRKRIIQAVISESSIILPDSVISNFKNSNPKSYLTFQLLGDYFKLNALPDSAIHYYNQSLLREVASKDDIARIKASINQCKQQL